jgi:hypothetical protein
MHVQGRTDQIRFGFGSCQDHQSEMPLADELCEWITVEPALDVVRAFSGDVVMRSAQVNSDQLQYAMTIKTMGGSQPSVGHPRIRSIEFAPSQTDT